MASGVEGEWGAARGGVFEVRGDSVLMRLA
jgi:hypothetical protein